MEYPKALYRGGKWDGVSEPDCVTVADAAAEKAAAADGYFAFGTEAKSEPEDKLQTMRAALEAKGVVVDNRWGEKRLQAELDKVK